MKQIFHLSESTYHPVLIECSEKEIPFMDITTMNKTDLRCISRDEYVFNKTGKLLEQKMYDGESFLSNLKILFYNDEEELVKEINYSDIGDVFIDIRVEFSEVSYQDGLKINRLYRQINSDSVNEGHIEYLYSDEYSMVNDPSQPNSGYEKMLDQNFIKVVEEWCIERDNRVLIGGSLEERTESGECIVIASFDAEYKIVSKTICSKNGKNSFSVSSLMNGSQIDYCTYDVNHNLMEKKVTHLDTKNYTKELYRYNDFGDITEVERQCFSTEDDLGNVISDDLPVNIDTYKGGEPNVIHYQYVYDEQNNWTRKIGIARGCVVVYQEREILYYLNWNFKSPTLRPRP